jgi:single-strand DNA-binding protein
MAIAKLGLAVNRVWKNEAGESKEEVTFIDIDSFGRQAETISHYLKKGSPLLVEGRLRLDQWDDKQTGQKRSKLGVVLEAFQFLGTANRGEPSQPSAASPPPPPPSASPPSQPPGESEAPAEEDDVPF